VRISRWRLVSDIIPFPRLVFESGPNLLIHRTFAEFLR
jgi:hypothetical protein